MNCRSCGKEIKGTSGLCADEGCKYGWYLDNPNEEINGTESFKVELITYYLKKHKRYRDIIYQLKSLQIKTFNFNVLESQRLTNWFFDQPDEFVKFLKAGILRAHYAYGGDDKTATILNRELNVVITESESIKLHDWGSQHEGIPLQVECQVIAAGIQETYLKSGEAYCIGCDDRAPLKSLGMIPKCLNKDCDRKRETMVIDRSTVKTGDVKEFIIQEPIEEAKHGTPTSFPCIIKDDFMKSTFVGQPKKVIGVFRSLPQKGKDTNMIMISTISITDLDDVKEIEVDKKSKEFFQTLVKKKDFLDIMTSSISPELKHEDLAKLCVLICCVGGTNTGRLRGDIHGILVGSPSAGKSTLLEFVLMIMQKAGFANGSTMSGTSVTASMDTLPNRTKMIRAGTIPLNTGGVVAIDEMNQLSSEDLGKMFEGMETGKIHYNKGGFDQMFDARTTIIGGANPKGYEYNFDISMMDNLGFMPPPMISRFDLITNMLSQKSETEEDEIEDHILLIRKIGVEEFISRNNLLTPKDLMKFIVYAKSFTPKSSPSTDKLLKDFSKKMRQIQVTEKGMKRVDKRFFESMIRISTAIAKIHLSDEVKEEHAMLAIEIYKKNLESFKIDTSEGVAVHKQEQFVTGKKSAFEVALHRLQAMAKDNRFGETEALQFLVDKYPQYFGNVDIAQKMFDEYYNKGKLSKSGGRFRLG